MGWRRPEADDGAAALSARSWLKIGQTLHFVGMAKGRPQGYDGRCKMEWDPTTPV